MFCLCCAWTKFGKAELKSSNRKFDHSPPPRSAWRHFQGEHYLNMAFWNPICKSHDFESDQLKSFNKARSLCARSKSSYFPSRNAFLYQRTLPFAEAELSS